MERVTIYCFAASYGVALMLELTQLITPRRGLRLLGLGFGAAGLLAHIFFFLNHTFFLAASPQVPLESPQGSLLFLALILTVFYLYGSIHHQRFAWGLFVLPLVLGLILLGVLLPSAMLTGGNSEGIPSDLFKRFWVLLHGVLVLFAAGGSCVGFLASVMYLLQVRRLRAKVPPAQGMKMFSLERIEAMNRRSILWAFPLLTAGLLVGLALLPMREWTNLSILSAVGLWVVFAVLLYLRYSVHVRGLQVALLTVFSFVLLVLAMVSAHPFVQGGTP